MKNCKKDRCKKTKNVCRLLKLMFFKCFKSMLLSNFTINEKSLVCKKIILICRSDLYPIKKYSQEGCVNLNLVINSTHAHGPLLDKIV